MVALRNYYSLLMYSFITCGHWCSMWDPLATRQMPHLQAILSHFRRSISVVDCLHSTSNSVLVFLYRLDETMYLIDIRSQRTFILCDCFVARKFPAYISNKSCMPPKPSANLQRPCVILAFAAGPSKQFLHLRFKAKILYKFISTTTHVTRHDYFITRNLVPQWHLVKRTHDQVPCNVTVPHPPGSSLLVYLLSSAARKITISALPSG